VGTSGPYRRALFSMDELPYLDHALAGQSGSTVDLQVDVLVNRMLQARSELEVLTPLVIFAKNVEPRPHFPRLLREFVTTGSMNALQALRAEEIDILLRAWHVDPKVSALAANRARLLLPLRRPDAAATPNKLSIGNLEKRPYLRLDPAELVARDGEQLACVLKRVMKAAKLTPTEMAKKTGISRSQVYYLTGSKSLPRKSDQLATFLMTCRLHPEQIKFVLDQWSHLDESRGEPSIEPELVAGHAADPAGDNAVAVSPTSAKATTPDKPTGMIRVDGPNGRSISVTNPRDDIDREKLVTLMAAVTGDAEPEWSKTRIFGSIAASLLLIAAFTTGLSLAWGESGGSSFVVGDLLSKFAAFGVVLLITRLATRPLLKSSRALVALVAGKHGKGVEPKKGEATRSSDGRPDIRLVA
jgi:hypothetical protein